MLVQSVRSVLQTSQLARCVCGNGATALFMCPALFVPVYTNVRVPVLCVGVSCWSALEFACTHACARACTFARVVHALVNAHVLGQGVEHKRACMHATGVPLLLSPSATRYLPRASLAPAPPLRQPPCSSPHTPSPSHFLTPPSTLPSGLPAPDVTLFMVVPPGAAAARGGFGQERYEDEAFQEQVGFLAAGCHLDQR